MYNASCCNRYTNQLMCFACSYRKRPCAEGERHLVPKIRPRGGRRSGSGGARIHGSTNACANVCLVVVLSTLCCWAISQHPNTYASLGRRLHVVECHETIHCFNENVSQCYFRLMCWRRLSINGGGQTSTSCSRVIDKCEFHYCHCKDNARTHPGRSYLSTRVLGMCQHS